MSRADLFPACASFGPIFIVIGCILPRTIASGPMAFVGAGATSYALISLYKMLGELLPTTEPEPTVTPPPTSVDNTSN